MVDVWKALCDRFIERVLCDWRYVERVLYDGRCEEIVL